MTAALTPSGNQYHLLDRMADLVIAGRREREHAQESLLAFTQRMYRGYMAPAHVRTLVGILEEVERTPDSRVIITMPPRHSKSLNVSEHFPAWYLGRHPDHRVIAASHTARLAYTFSRRVRNKIARPDYPFRKISVAGDRSAVQNWDIEGHHGGYVSVGVGGSPTGEGANLIIIDDPIRGASDADSEVVRESIWEWYTDTIRGRLQPGGSIVLTACMVGDTEVMMADGSEKHLRYIEVGDSVATYENGRITSSRVLNWINHGPDSVLEIMMTSGKVVRANARHPFLVDTGEALTWIRLRNLKAGDRLVGASTRESPAISTGATSQQSARGTAALTTTRRDGPAVTGLHQSTRRHEGKSSSDTGMALPERSTTNSLRHRGAGALSVANFQATITCQNTGLVSSASITATTPERFEDCSAITATSPSDDSVLRRSSSAHSNTSDFTLDEIVSIVPAGIEDVFDIEVERTENFIANGVVSHNTRWHTDDLTGRLLQAGQSGGEQWQHIHMPALDEADNPLWPEFWSQERLDALRRSVSARAWAAQYLGEPVPSEGAILHTGWFPRYDRIPANATEVIQSWDTAYKTSNRHDYTVCITAAQSPTDLYITDVWREKVEMPELQRAFRWQSLAWRPRQSLIEDKASGTSLIQWARHQEGMPPVIARSGTIGKEARANDVAPHFEAGRVHLPTSAPWLDDFLTEIQAFPLGIHDDQVDALTHMTDQVFGQLAGAGVRSRSWMEDAAEGDDDDV